MSQNLNLLRQKYCRTATVTGKRSHCLFPLEKECDEGKALTKAPETFLQARARLDEFGGKFAPPADVEITTIDIAGVACELHQPRSLPLATA